MLMDPQPLRSLVSCAQISSQAAPEGASPLSEDESNQIIRMADRLEPEAGRTLAAPGDQGEGQAVRDVLQYPIPLDQQTAWIYRKLLDAAVRCNSACEWDFDLTGFHRPLQLLRYEPSGQYGWHTDLGTGGESARKISISVLLSKPEDHEGGVLEIWSGGQEPTPTVKEQGAIVLFPSYVLHRVTPVTRGRRWAAVGWIQGQRHFR